MPELLLPEDKVIWAEEVEAENQAEADELPPRQEFIKDGIKTVVDYYKNDEEKTVKTISKYKIETKRVSKAVAMRKKLHKFGHAKNDPPGPNVANTSIGDAIKIQFVRSRGGELLELTKNEDDLLAKLVKQGTNLLRCRFCKSSDHMSAHCPYKDLVENTMESLENASGGQSEETLRQKEAEEKMKSGIYVPVSMRGGPGSAARSSMDTSRRDDFTVRVTNLPDETTDDDLKEMFSSVGKVQRVFLAKDKATLRCKGFAFVTYCNREDAEKAIHTISGHRYDHLILKVEWARPTN